MDTVVRIVHAELAGKRKVKDAHRGVIVQADPRALGETDIAEGVKGIARVVKNPRPPSR